MEMIQYVQELFKVSLDFPTGAYLHGVRWKTIEL